MDGRSLTTPSLNAALQRADCEHAPDPAACMHVASDVEQSLSTGEFVLECANTTHPGFHSLLAVTNRRILLGAGPGKLDVIDITALTRWRIIQQPELALELQVFNTTCTIYGLGHKGITRITHALRSVVKAQVESPPTMASTMVEMLNNSWLNMQKSTG